MQSFVKDPSLAYFELQAKLGALRWLQQINFVPISRYYGIADRTFWSWKTKDFPNATLQGGLAGFLDVCKLLNFNQIQIRQIIKVTLLGTYRIQRRNGSFEEAYPLESSYCVTGLVVFNLLYSFYKYKASFSDPMIQTLKAIVKKGYSFLMKNKEFHGVISNHIVTCELAKILAENFLNLTPISNLQKVCNLKHHTEHWFQEYGGPDPGYQLLLNHYLSAYLTLLPTKTIHNLLSSSHSFVAEFCFPDGSFAGEVGNRGTQIVYPSGLFTCKQENIFATKEIDWFFKYHLYKSSCVTPTSVDNNNLVPLFNSWALAFQLLKFNDSLNEQWSYESTISKNNFLKIFPDGKLLILRQSHSMAVLSLKNSSLRKVTFKEKNWQDESIAFWIKGKKSTQGVPIHNLLITEKNISWVYNSHVNREIVFSPIHAIVIRLLSILTYPFNFLQNLLKRAMALYAFSPKSYTTTSIKACITLSEDTLPVSFTNTDNWKSYPYGFLKHTASANTFTERAL